MTEMSETVLFIHTAAQGNLLLRNTRPAKRTGKNPVRKITNIHFGNIYEYNDSMRILTCNSGGFYELTVQRKRRKNSKSFG